MLWHSEGSSPSSQKLATGIYNGLIQSNLNSWRILTINEERPILILPHICSQLCLRFSKVILHPCVLYVPSISSFSFQDPSMCNFSRPTSLSSDMRREKAATYEWSVTANKPFTLSYIKVAEFFQVRGTHVWRGEIDASPAVLIIHPTAHELLDHVISDNTAIYKWAFTHTV
jgi:hypothetical protein